MSGMVLLMLKCAPDFNANWGTFCPPLELLAPNGMHWLAEGNETVTACNALKLMPDSLAGLTSILPLLGTGEALILGDAVLLPSRIKLDKPTIAPDSATRDFWKNWGTQAPDVDAITKAVESLRSQTRGNAV